MGKKWQIALIAVLVTGLGWLVLSSREPAYEGKSLTAWVEQYGTNRFPQDKKAETAIRHFGSNATPVFLAWMTTRESPLRLQLTAHAPRAWLTNFHIADAAGYHHEVDHRRTMGAHGLAALGPDAKPAIPALIQQLADKDQRVRYLTVFALRCLGPVAAEALPSLIACLKDPDFTIRDDAVMGLGTIHQQPERVVPIIGEFVEKYRTDNILCTDALRALGEFGTQATPAVPVVVGFLSDPRPDVRSEATNALAKIAPQAAAQVEMK